MAKRRVAELFRKQVYVNYSFRSQAFDIGNRIFKEKPRKQKEGEEEEKWKWLSVKQSGNRPSPRCGFSLVATPGNRALLFGGVFDEVSELKFIAHYLFRLCLKYKNGQM